MCNYYHKNDILNQLNEMFLRVFKGNRAHNILFLLNNAKPFQKHQQIEKINHQTTIRVINK